MSDNGVTAIVGALSDFSIASITPYVTAALGIAVPLILFWFGFRFIFKKGKGALKRGN